MVDKRPTHRIVHNRLLYEANIYIAASLEQKLKSTNPKVRKGAQDSVCIRFREAVKAKYNIKSSDAPWVNWRNLEIEKIPSEREVERHCCDRDNCINCDMGAHERCRYGCTIGRY